MHSLGMSRTQQLALSKRSPKVSSAAPLAKKPTRLPHDNLLHAPKENNIALFFVVFVIYVEAELPRIQRSCCFCLENPNDGFWGDGSQPLGGLHWPLLLTPWCRASVPWGELGMESDGESGNQKPLSCSGVTSEGCQPGVKGRGSRSYSCTAMGKRIKWRWRSDI